jgi:hypothetical protein
MADLTPMEMKRLRKQLGAAFRRLDAGLSQLWEKEKVKRLPELMIHAQNGMGFRIHIEVVNPDGTPLDQRELPRHVEPEPPRRIVLLGDDD